jgi:hypothetical protein
MKGTARNVSPSSGVTFARMEERSSAGGQAGGDGAAAQPSRGDSPRGLQGLTRPLFVAWLLVLAWVTLTPVPPSGDPGEPMSRFCLVCGDRGTADAILNLFFFAPLGIALAYRPRAALLALVTGAALSVSVELAQIVVPGRYPTFGDVVWNALGAALAALAMRGLAAHLEAPSPWAGCVAALLVGGGLALGGWLLGHAPTRADYYGQWTPDLGYMPQYRGTLVSASLDGLPMPSAKIADDVRARERLDGDWTVDARVVKGEAPRAVSPIFSVYDADESEVLLLGAHGEDLVLRERTRAKAIVLDHPDLRLPGALATFDVGDTLAIGARRVGERRCLSVGSSETCGLGFTPGRTWGLLLYLEGPTEDARRVVDAAWLMTLILPIGAFALSPRGLATNAILLAALVASGVALTRLATPPWWEIAGGVAGLAVGWIARRSAVALGARRMP